MDAVRVPMLWIILVMITLAASAHWLIAIPTASHQVLLVSLTLVNITLVVMAISQGIRPILLMTAVFAQLWLVTPATYQLGSGNVPWQDSGLLGRTGDITAALSVGLATSVAFMVGCVLRRRSSSLSVRRRPSLRRGRDLPLDVEQSRVSELAEHLGESSTAREHRVVARERTSSRLWKFGLVLTLASVTMLPYVASHVGGIQGLFTYRKSATDSIQAVIGTQDNKAIAGFVQNLPGNLSTVAVMALILSMKMRRAGKSRRPAVVFTLMVALGTVVLYSNPMTKTRFQVAAAIVPILLCWLRPRSSKSGLMALVAMVGGLLIVYPLMNLFRNAEVTTSQINFGWQLFSTIDFDGFQQFVNTVTYVHAAGHSLGWYTVSAVLFFIPRNIWSSKASPASFDVAASRGYVFQNLSLPLPAELYLEFGVVGAMVVCFLLGNYITKLDIGWGQDGLRDVPLVALITGALLGVFRGPLGAQIPVVEVAFVLVWCMSRMIPVEVTDEEFKPSHILSDGNGGRSRSRLNRHNGGIGPEDSASNSGARNPFVKTH